MKPPARRTTIRSDLPSDLLEDFRLEAAEQLPRCELLLIELERAPKSAERLRELFRLIHTLKGNLGYVELNALMTLPQAIEDVLDALPFRVDEAHRTTGADVGEKPGHQDGLGLSRTGRPEDRRVAGARRCRR